MDSYKIKWDAKALKELDKLPEKRVIQILQKITALSKNPYIGKALKGAFQNYYRLRVGDFRIIYSIKKKILVVVILQIGNRTDIYKKLK